MHSHRIVSAFGHCHHHDCHPPPRIPSCPLYLNYYVQPHLHSLCAALRAQSSFVNKGPKKKPLRNVFDGVVWRLRRLDAAFTDSYIHTYIIPEVDMYVVSIYIPRYLVSAMV